MCHMCSAMGSRIDNTAQFPLTLAHGFQDVPGGSIVKPCPESHRGDVLAIERIVNKPQVPYLQVPCFNLAIRSRLTTRPQK